jgi:hypothetical protein
MNAKASAVRKIVAFRTPSYNRSSFSAQLLCSLLTLALLALPIAGSRPEHSRVLTPLATALVPLDASVQSPPCPLPQIPSMLVSGRIVLGSPPSPAILISSNHASGVWIPILRISDPDALESPNVRSPPFA